MRALGDAAREETRVYLTGGATAVLHGWRNSTIDIDLRIDPERDEILRQIPALKERLAINVEFASPADFIPVKRDWAERSPFAMQAGRVSIYHFDMYAQALSKIERGHEQDLQDVRSMISAGLVKPHLLGEYFAAVEPLLYRYPAIDPAAFRRAVAEFSQ